MNIALMIRVLVCGVSLLASSLHAAPPPRAVQLSFDTPQQAGAALVDAARHKDKAQLRRVLGPGAGRVIASGDPAQDEATRQAFLTAAEQATFAEASGEDRAVLLLGNVAWPLPFPLVRDAGQRWHFDTRAGLQEFLDRQIGANELAAIQVVRAYVDAQREYVLRDRNRNGLLEYAQRLISSPGQRDGLYWPGGTDQPDSPLGAAIAAAEARKLPGLADSPQPLHGYFFRVLKAQGAGAPGGALSYLVGNRMIGGFALVAWPARWGVSGVVSFTVNHEGVVYSRNLGKDTARIAAAMTSFDPQPGWEAETSGVRTAKEAALALQDTDWRLAGEATSPRVPHLQLLEGGRVAGSDGCNRLIGSYALDGAALSFGPLASSRLVCLEINGRDREFQQTLLKTQQWRVAGRKLELIGEGAVLLGFEAALR